MSSLHHHPDQIHKYQNIRSCHKQQDANFFLSCHEKYFSFRGKSRLFQLTQQASKYFYILVLADELWRMLFLGTECQWPGRGDTQRWLTPHCWCIRTIHPRVDCPPPRHLVHTSRPVWTRGLSQCWRSRPGRCRRGRRRGRRWRPSSWVLASAHTTLLRPWCRTLWWQFPWDWRWRSWCWCGRRWWRPADPREQGWPRDTTESPHQTPGADQCGCNQSDVSIV